MILFHHETHHESCDYHWVLYAHSLLFQLHLGFLYLSSSGSANAQLSGCFCLWTFSLNIWLNMLPLDSFTSCLHSLLGYSTGEFHALQLNVLAAFGGVYLSRASCMLVHFLEIWFEMIVGLYVWHKGNNVFCCFWWFHILMPYNMIFYFRLPYFYASNNALFSK